MVVVAFDSRKLFTLKVFDSSWLWYETRVTDKLKPEAVSLMGFESISLDEKVYKSVWEKIRAENTRISLIKNL